MRVPKSASVRHRTSRTDDGKGLRRMIAGQRFRAPFGVGEREADHRFHCIEQVWSDNEAFCRRLRIEVRWTDIALWAAEALRKGEVRIRLQLA